MPVLSSRKLVLQIQNQRGKNKKDVYCVHITSFKYSQEDSETKCTSGLIGEIDYAVFKSQLEIYPDGKINNIIVYKKNLNDTKFEMVQFLNVDQQCFNSNFNSSDCKRISEYVIEITIKIRALKEISLGKIKISASENGKITFSEEQQLPEIYDSTNAVGNLTVNGFKMQNKNSHCFSDIEDTDLELKYTCESKARPCLIAVSYYQSMQLLDSKLDNYTLVFHIPKPEKDDVRIIFSYGACRLDGDVNVQTCFTEMDYQSAFEKEVSKEHVLPIIVALITLILLTILCLMVIFFKAWKVRKICMKKSELLKSSPKENKPLNQSDVDIEQKDIQEDDARV
ncbi:unnamed protein product [Lymnaea stagnalis]|uniref:Uncharacterized protein n=1 Tax=Lymnaea stagnalis TaxID=6523 RepID=A0AAV2HQD4_LYMST